MGCPSRSTGVLYRYATPKMTVWHPAISRGKSRRRNIETTSTDLLSRILLSPAQDGTETSVRSTSETLIQLWTDPDRHCHCWSRVEAASTTTSGSPSLLSSRTGSFDGEPREEDKRILFYPLAHSQLERVLSRTDKWIPRSRFTPALHLRLRSV